jgi:hypothetical protein
MKGRIWLIPMLIYLAIGIADGTHDFRQSPPGSSTVGALAVAFCAGLFWPIDVVARPLLMSH